MKLSLAQDRSDAELLALIGISDNLAFNELYGRYWKLVFNAAYKLFSKVYRQKRGRTFNRSHFTK